MDRNVEALVTGIENKIGRLNVMLTSPTIPEYQKTGIKQKLAALRNQLEFQKKLAEQKEMVSAPANRAADLTAE